MPASQPKTTSLSLRDPDGVLIKTESGKIYRFVHARQAPFVERTIGDVELQRKLKLVSTSIVPEKQSKTLWRQYGELTTLAEKDWGLTLEHKPVFFPSYPYEWCREALVRAGNMTLDLAEASLERGWGIKDATPYNILFEGTQPTFVDWLSLELRVPTDPTWIPFSQFVRNFILPLWMDRHSGLALNSCFLTYRDGLEPERAYQLVPWLQRFRPSFFTLVTVPVWLTGRRLQQRQSQTELYRKMQTSPDRARFILSRLYRFLRDQLERVSDARKSYSAWVGYLDKRSPYEKNQWEFKKKVLQEWLTKIAPQTVLDIGCNQGWFSELAARSGAKVVGIDSDPEMVRQCWRRADSKKLDILPLQVDLCRPSPAVGWRNGETASFLERAQAKFDVTALLAVVHHLSVAERIPYSEIFSVIAETTRKHCLIEFVGPEDPSFAWAAKGRDSENWNRASFLKALAPHFFILEQKPIPETDRCLFLLESRKKS